MDLQYPCFVGGSDGNRRGAPNPHLELQRAQLQEYAQRMQLGLRVLPGQLPGVSPLPYHSAHLMSPYFHPYLYKDPRTRFVHEEPKPNHSYIGLIGMGILASRDQKLVLSDIYQWILDHYSYFRTRGPGWRNSIRHNLSLNDCFIKSGRSANGKGHYWAIHPANLEDFRKGDFRRRRAQRRVRRHMGLSITDDDDDDSPVPSPVTQRATSTSMIYSSGYDENSNMNVTQNIIKTDFDTGSPIPSLIRTEGNFSANGHNANGFRPEKRARRQFDMDSLLAPDIPHSPVDYTLQKELGPEINGTPSNSVVVDIGVESSKSLAIASTDIQDNSERAIKGNYVFLDTRENDSDIEKEDCESESSIGIDCGDEAKEMSTNKKDNERGRDLENGSYNDSPNDIDDIQYLKTERDSDYDDGDKTVEQVSEEAESAVRISPVNAQQFVYYRTGHLVGTSSSSQQHINEHALQLSKYMSHGLFGVPHLQMPTVLDAYGKHCLPLTCIAGKASTSQADAQGIHVGHGAIPRWHHSIASNMMPNIGKERAVTRNDSPL